MQDSSLKYGKRTDAVALEQRGRGRDATFDRQGREACATALRRHGHETGAAALELAMTVPLLIMLCAIGLNFTTYFGYTAKADTIASVACRYVMDNSSETPTSSNLKRALSAQFPELNSSDGSFDVRVEARGSETEELSYPLYIEGKLQNLNTRIGSSTYCITVSTKQAWPALGFVFSNADGMFSVSSQRLCEVDRLQDSKWIEE